MTDTVAGPAKRRRVVVGIDDASGVSALRWAVRQARDTGSQLVAVRSWTISLPRHGGTRHRRKRHSPVVLVFAGIEQREESAEIVRRAFGSAIGGIPRDVALTVETPEGDPGAALADMAIADGDLLVVGTGPGRSARRMLHGSVSGYCCEHAQCPVVVIPAAGPDGSAAPGTPPGHRVLAGSASGSAAGGQS